MAEFFFIKFFRKILPGINQFMNAAGFMRVIPKRQDIGGESKTLAENKRQRSKALPNFGAKKSASESQSPQKTSQPYHNKTLYLVDSQKYAHLLTH